ncbi:MAG: BPSS1780 family membrane protein [Kangiellaceae bacterium]|nr:BPSS1780 family membrane protein [Kangiellaceae bacterium]
MADDFYQSPNSEITPPPNNNSMRKVPAGSGVKWVTDAIGYILKAPGTWLAGTFIFIICIFILAFIPLVNMVINVLAPVFTAGFIYGCDRLRKNKEFKVDHIFVGFQQKFGPLAIVGLIYFGCTAAIMTLTIIIMMGLGFELLDIQDLNSLQNIPPQDVMTMVLLPMLVAMALMIPVLMAYWFAPALVLLRNEEPVQAMKKSFKACLENFVPFLVYGVVATLGIIALLIVLSFIGAITVVLLVPAMFIGYLLIIAVVFATIYTAFVDIFPEDEDSNNIDSQEDIVSEDESSITL